MRWTTFCALCTFLFASQLCWAQATQKPPKPNWYTSWELAERAAQSKKESLVVYVFNSTARGCKLMQEDTFTNPEVASMMTKFNLLALNADTNMDRCQELDVFRVPTVILLDAKGEEIDRATGYKDPGAFMKYLQNALEYANKERDEEFTYGGEDILNPGPNRYAVTLNFKAGKDDKVQVVGDFNDWRGDSTPLTRSELGMHQVTIYLYQGVYEYLFLVNDADYEPDPQNPLKKPNPYGTVNSVFIIGNAKFSPMVDGREVTFILYNTDAKEIKVAGSFNNWEGQMLYRKADDPGMWGMRFTLPPGEYTYKYVIDGEWTADPENYWPIADREGNLNSSFRVQ